MAKRCIICEEKEATYKIKETSDYYCQECAEENFSDLSVLIKVEEDAKYLKEFVKERIKAGLINEEALDESEKEELNKNNSE
tara:strand:- start:1380 stop:1625 length:246 start_codon:yes stop_codon:yes gene_type:complete